MTFTTSGGLGEAETAGLVMNIVPKTGGNTHVRARCSSAAPASTLQSDNFTQELSDAGLAAPTPLTQGVRPQRSVRRTDQEGPGVVLRERPDPGQHADHRERVLQPERRRSDEMAVRRRTLSRPAFSDRTWENVSGRITWQATPRNKIGGFWDEQAFCRKCSGMTSGHRAIPARVSPEAIGVSGDQSAAGDAGELVVARDQPAASGRRLRRQLLPAGAIGTRRETRRADLIRVVEQCASGCAANGGIPGLVYRSQDLERRLSAGSYNVARVGLVRHRRAQHEGRLPGHAADRRSGLGTRTTSNLTYPCQQRRAESAHHVDLAVRHQLARRLSTAVLRAGAVDARPADPAGRAPVRPARSWFPEQQEGPTRFLPTPIVCPETKGVDCYKDVTPRMGVAYDVFGNGRTAIKVNLGKYLEGVGHLGN